MKITKNKVGQKVYSYQNKDYSAPINKLVYSPWNNSGKYDKRDTYKYVLSLKDGNSNFIDEKSISKKSIGAVKKKAAPKKVAKKKLTPRDYDMRYSAKKPGKRITTGKNYPYKKGNIYYETRGNRSDKGKLLGIERINVEINVGDILECSWGYDQTNIDFYYVIKKAGSYITFIPMSNKIVEYNSNDMTGKVVPNEPNYTAKPLRRKIQKSSISNSIWVKINSYSSASKWNGKPQYFSSYA